MKEITFTVPGNPVGKGRAKAARRGKFITMYTPEKTASYESLVAFAGNVAMSGSELITGPVSVESASNQVISLFHQRLKKYFTRFCDE